MNVFFVAARSVDSAELPITIDQNRHCIAQSGLHTPYTGNKGPMLILISDPDDVRVVVSPLRRKKRSKS